MSDCMSSSELSNLLTSEYDKVLNNINYVSPTYLSEIASIQNDINNMIQTPKEVLDAQVNSISSAANSWISDYASDSCYQLATSVIERCNFFSDNPLLKDPLRFLQSVGNNLTSYILSKIDEMANNLPEIQIAGTIASLWNKLSGSTSNITSSIRNLLDLSDCFQNLGQEIAAIIDAITSLMDSLCLTINAVGDIVMNIDKIFEGVVDTVKDAIVGVYNTISGIVNDAVTKFNEGVEFFKNKTAQLQKGLDQITI